MIGSHTIIQSKDADADRAFIRDVLGLSGIDPGGGWLIHALPPSELAVHPSSNNDVHEHYLICDDVDTFVGDVTERGGVCSAIQELRWGRLTQVALPGGGKLGVYQALHARPESPMNAESAKTKTKTKTNTNTNTKTKTKTKTNGAKKPAQSAKTKTKANTKTNGAKKAAKAKKRR